MVSRTVLASVAVSVVGISIIGTFFWGQSALPGFDAVQASTSLSDAPVSEVLLALRSSATADLLRGSAAAFLAVSGGNEALDEQQFHDAVTATLHAYVANATVAAAAAAPIAEAPLAKALQLAVAEGTQRMKLGLPRTARALWAACNVDGSGNVSLSEFEGCMQPLAQGTPSAWFSFFLGQVDHVPMLTPAHVHPILTEWAGVMLSAVQQQFEVFQLAAAGLISTAASTALGKQASLSVPSLVAQYEASTLHSRISEWLSVNSDMIWPKHPLLLLFPCEDDVQAWVDRRSEAGTPALRDGKPVTPWTLRDTDFSQAALAKLRDRNWGMDAAACTAFGGVFTALEGLAAAAVASSTLPSFPAVARSMLHAVTSPATAKTALRNCSDVDFLLEDVAEAVFPAWPAVIATLFPLADTDDDGTLQYAEYAKLTTLLFQATAPGYTQANATAEEKDVTLIRALLLQVLPLEGAASGGDGGSEAEAADAAGGDAAEELVEQVTVGLQSALAFVHTTVGTLLGALKSVGAPHLADAAVNALLAAYDVNIDGVVTLRELESVLSPSTPRL